MPQPGDDAPITFTRAAGKRIADAVRKVEIGDRGGGALTFRKPQELPKGKVFRVCTFTGAWASGSFKEVTFKYVTTTPNTVSAVNLFFSLPDDGTADCAIAKDGTAWHLIQWRWVTSTCAT